MNKPKDTEEIRIKNQNLEHRILSDLKECDILLICAPMGWGKYAFLVDFYYKNAGNIYWLEKAEGYSLEQQIKDLPQAEERVIIIPRLEKVIRDGDFEVVKRLATEKKKGDSILISSEVPFPQEMLPHTLFYKINTYGIDALKPANKEIGEYFHKKGIKISQETLRQIEQDFNNMPLCIYLLGNLLTDSGEKYSKLMRERCFEDVYAYIDVMLFHKLKVKEQEQLLYISCLDCFDETVVAAMLDMQVKQGREFLQQLLEMGSILVAGKEGWRFDSLFARFLNRARHKYLTMEEIRNMYRKALVYAGERKKWKEALRYAYILESEEQMAEYLEKLLYNNRNFNDFLELEEYLQNISLFCLMKHPMLMISKATLETINGNMMKSAKYEEMFEKYIMQMANPGEKEMLEGELMYLRLARMGAVNMEELQELLVKVKNYKAVTRDSERFKAEHLSVLHGEKDYCDVLVNEKTGNIFSELRRLTEGVLDNVFNQMYGFAEAEILYEQNKLDQALNLLSRTLWEAGTTRNQRMQQVCTVAMADLLLAKNQLDNMEEFVTQKIDISEERGTLFADNLAAHQVYFYLVKNEKEKIMEWLQRQAPDEKGRFFTIHYYQYLIKAKVYIWMENYVLAMLILQTLQEFSENYGMRYLEMKVRILKAVIYQKEESERWKEELVPALEYGEKVHFIRVFAEEGAILYGLLQELAQKDSKWMDNSYFKEVLSAVRAHMLQYPQYMKQQMAIDISEFTSHEKEIMKLLANGDKNAEIAKKLFVSENTIKYHLKNVFQKLDVKSRGQAINKIKEYNLV